MYVHYIILQPNIQATVRRKESEFSSVISNRQKFKLHLSGRRVLESWHGSHSFRWIKRKVGFQEIVMLTVEYHVFSMCVIYSWCTCAILLIAPACVTGYKHHVIHTQPLCAPRTDKMKFLVSNEICQSRHITSTFARVQDRSWQDNLGRRTAFRIVSTVNRRIFVPLDLSSLMWWS